jgi:hypothetical protein
MKWNKIILYSLGCLAFVFFLTAASSQKASDSQNHCYALLSPVNPNSGEFSQILETKCFDSFSESLGAATKGRVQLDSSISPENVTEDILNDNIEKKLTDLQIVIGIDWDNSSFSGSSYIWVVSNGGCSNSVQYSVSSMPTGWDNRVSSARAYSPCNYFHHYQNTSHGGSSLICNTIGCSSMGLLNNATSSEKWTYTP